MNVDDTKYRVIGDTSYPLGTTENYQYISIYAAMAKAKIKPIHSLHKAEKPS